MSPSPATAAATSRQRHGARRDAGARVPRRVSGPARPRPRPRAVTSGGAVALPRSPGLPPLGRRALRRAGQLADHPFLERLLTGRAWIALIAFALIGIVFMQVSLLKLNAGIGRSVERAALLDRQNGDLRDVVSRLGSDERLQAEAAKMGLELPPAGAVTFLGRNGRRVGGDGPITLATGTATGPQLAGVGAGALAPTATAPAPAGTTASPAPAAQTQTAPAGTTASPPATGVPPATTATTPAATTPAAPTTTTVAPQQP
jgi:hypothetical protein